VKVAVIGLGFGDEGKGLVTDYLCSKLDTDVVVRYSGGQQAGHTVIRDGNRHVFSNLGSGTLQGVPTYWSKFCTVDPMGIINEKKVLEAVVDEVPPLYIDPEAPVTTPFDKYANQNSDKMLKNGTCGCGVGTTFQREEDFYHLQWKDLYIDSVFELKLKAIEDHYGFSIDTDEFINQCRKVRDDRRIVTGEFSIFEYDNILFEGSQGLLLDQHHGFFPHVTRSNTGSKNILKLVDDVTPWVVTRAYQTRHGNGPMTLENVELNVEDNPNETNVSNKYQGKFRKSVLDLDLISHGIQSDSFLRHKLVDGDINLVITCMDQMEKPLKLKYENRIIEYKSPRAFMIGIRGLLGIENVFYSKGDTAEDIVPL